MRRRWRVALGLVALAVLVLPTSALAGDAYIKGGIVLGGNNGAFTNRWFISTGTDWGVTDSAYLGLEFQGAFRSNSTVGNSVVDSVPANLFLNGKWKSNTDDVRPYAGLGFGMVSTYVRSTVNGATTTQYVKDGAFQLMGGVELNQRWVLELLGQHVFQDGAGWRWSFLGGIRF